MTDETVDKSTDTTDPADPWARPPVNRAPGPAGSAATDATDAADVPGRRSSRKKRRRSWKWWLANLMILAGVLCIPLYFLGTCGYTWLQQNQLRQQLEEANPQLAGTGPVFSAADLQSMEPATVSTQEATANAAEIAAAEAAEAARRAELAAFKVAADAFQASIAGKTGEPLGRIVIPSIGVDVIMVEGTGKGDLKIGPGHWPETPFPGQGGNFVVSGHRTTYGAPFFKLNEVKVGDEIDLIMPYAVARYTVTRVIIVLPTEVDAVAQLGREQISLAACHPIYSAKQRIVVQGDLTGYMLIEAQG
jgi:LPXTG-site transpeptidase (sortase) family protein